MPETYQLPPGACSVQTLWQQWIVGQPPLPPLRHVTCLDVPRKQRKKFSDISFLMHLIETFITEMPNAPALRKLTPLEATNVYMQVQGRLEAEIGTTSNRGRTRRLAQLGWKTVANNLSHFRKRKRK